MSIAENTPANGSSQISKPASSVRVVEDHGPVAHLMDTARFEHTYRIANAMAAAALIPDHLLGVKKGQEFVYYTEKQIVGNCFLVCNQSLRWGIDPFAAMPETYAIGGKLGFQGKLVAAVINTRAGLKRRLNYTFSGAGEDLTITVVGTFEGEDEPRTITLSVKQAKTSNDMWRKDPEQKLIYTGATKWARRHCPEVMLGVLTDDDLEQINETRTVTSKFTPPQSLEDLTDRTAAAQQPTNEPAPVRTQAVDSATTARDDANGMDREASQASQASQANNEVHQGEHIEDVGQSEQPGSADDFLIPFAEKIEELTGVEAVNLARIKAGKEHPELVEAINQICDAKLAVIRNSRGQRSNKQ